MLFHPECTKQMDLVFILDLSGSLSNLYDLSIEFMTTVIYGLPMHAGRARIALITYANSAKVEFYLNTYQSKQEVLNALSFRAAGRKTNTQEAINRAYSDVFSSGRGDRSGVDNIAIIITDGKSNGNTKDTVNAANRARQNHIEVFVAATSNRANMGEVQGIANDPDNSHVVSLNSKGEAQSAANRILNQLCD